MNVGLNVIYFVPSHANCVDMDGWMEYIVQMKMNFNDEIDHKG